MVEQAIGNDTSKEIVTYCNTGIMSSVGWFVLSKLSGYTNVKMYDGALQEWSKDPAAPVEK
jgi:thiosulfate/3-mercaptopyruvate sulfurtransferase